MTPIVAATLAQTTTPIAPPAPADGRAGITGIGALVVFGLIVAGLLLMRARLLRR